VSKNINWCEGTFVQPHHFQQAFLNIEESLASFAADYIPHFSGISRLEIGSCDGYQFEIRAIDCRFPDGTRILGGTDISDRNASIDSRGFQEQFEKSGNRLDVYLALPKLTNGNKNCLGFNDTALSGKRYRFLAVEDEVPDLVNGENKRPIQHKLYRPQILFRSRTSGGEQGDSTEGYDLLKIAQLKTGTVKGEYRSLPAVDESFVPPCICLSASPRLSFYFSQILSRLNAKYLNLREYWRHKDTAFLMKTRDTFKVQAVTASFMGLSQYKSISHLHPFTLYAKLAEIVGTLSIYTDKDELIVVPDYDHNNLGSCYASLFESMEKLLALLEEVVYEEAPFEVKSDELLVCTLQNKWLDENNHLYLCFESPLPEPLVVREINGLKVAAEQEIPNLNLHRLHGLKLEGPVHHIRGLPSGANRHFFKIPRDANYFPKLVDNPALAIWGKQFAEVVRLFIVDKEKV